MRRARIFLIGLLLAGCYPDLGVFEVVDDPEAGVPPGRDAGDGPVTACAPPVTCTSGCPLPWLLASVEDLSVDEECGGQVWRFALTGEHGDFCTCEPLTGGGTMPKLPFSVGFSPPETVVVAAETDSVMAIDGRSDSVLWQEPYSPQPVDVFAIEDPSGTPMIGVAGRMRGGDIRSIAFYDAAAGGSPIERTLNTGDLPLGLSVSSVSQSTFDPSWFRALRSDMYASLDVDPWNDVTVDPPHTASRDGFFLETLHSSFDGTWHRTVWTGENGENGSAVYRLAVADDSGDNRVPLPDRCDRNPDGSMPYEVDCEYLHAVADPQLNTSSIALCQYDGSSRRIVRLRLTGECYTVADDASIRARVRISRLALGQQTLWP